MPPFLFLVLGQMVKLVGEAILTVFPSISTWGG